MSTWKNDKYATPSPKASLMSDSNEVELFITCGISQQDPTTISLLLPMYADTYFVGKQIPEGNEPWKQGKFNYFIYLKSSKFASTQLEEMTKCVFRKLKAKVKPVDNAEGLIEWIKKNSSSTVTNIE